MLNEKPPILTIILCSLLLFRSLEQCSSFPVARFPANNAGKIVSQTTSFKQQNQQSKAATSTILRLSSNSEEEQESINPNDLETPEERQRRMEMVRQIQKTFYHTGSSDSETPKIAYKSEACPSQLQNVPLWRVQWTELPGWQNLLNCHVAHYTHMFHSILAGPKPWLFGHVFLPEGSKNLNNPEYQFRKRDDENNKKNKATYTGVLMQVTDYQQLEDGRLVLVVQALERFRVLEATQHEPYAVANVQLLPDSELALPFYKEAQKMAQELSEDFLNDNDAWGAACAAALETAEQHRGFEYRPVRIAESGNGAISPLVNFNMDVDVEKSFPSDSKRIESRQARIRAVMEKHLLSASPVTVPETIDDLDEEKVLQLEHDVWVEIDTLIGLLRELNPNPKPEVQQIPIPTQMLGLLPRKSSQGMSSIIPWPSDFQLEQYAERLEESSAAMTVGTYSKSPFVRYDFAETEASPYPALRRAQRLSFVVWILVESIGITGDNEEENSRTKPLSRQEILELGSISERLGAAKDRLVAINKALKVVADQ